MFKKSLWFAIVMSLFMVGVNFVDAKSSSSSSSGGFSSGSKSSFSSGGSSGFTSGGKSTTSSVSATSGFTSGSKATAPSGFTSGSKSDTAPSSAATSSGKTDMMSKSVQQERSNSVYNATDKPAAAPSSGGSASVNTGGASPGSGSHTVVRETTVIRDRSSGPSWFPVPIFLGGGGGGDHTTVINNGQPSAGNPGYVDGQGNNTRFHDTRSEDTRFWSIFFFILGVLIIGLVIYGIVKKRRNL